MKPDFSIFALIAGMLASDHGTLSFIKISCPENSSEM
jgi:hypothetical protein